VTRITDYLNATTRPPLASDGPWTEERMESNDHDLLIRIDTRMDGIERDLKSLQSTLVKDVAALDVRTRVLEDRALKFPAQELTNKYNTVTQEWNDFKVRLAVWGAVVIVGGALLGNFFRLVVFPLLGIKP
jgi:hypothetical protein